MWIKPLIYTLSTDSFLICCFQCILCITAMFNPELPPPGMIPRLVHLQPPRTYQPHVLMPAVASDIGVNRDTHHGG